MRRTLLWLLAFITAVTEADPLRVMSSPNPLRVGAAENVFVECQDCGEQGPMHVRISVWNHPTKNTELGRTTVTLNSSNDFQAFGELVIPADSFDKDPTAKQYVQLLAEFPGHTLEKVVLVSFQSGVMFIQTDRTLYRPDSTVNFRIFALTPDMKPIERDEATGNPAAVTVEIVTPEGTVIPRDPPVLLKSGMHDGSYTLGEYASIGQWKVVTRFQSNPRQLYSAEFEVKKYVLPRYEVKLTSDTPFYYYDTESFDVRVKASYLFGKAVDGMAYVVFGVMKDGYRKTFPASMQRIPIIDGSGQATLQKDHILKTYPTIEELVGESLFVTATVYTESGSEMVKGELRNMQVVQSPYIINFDKTPKYFTAGMSFEITVTVTNPDGTPAGGVPVVVEPGEDVFNTTTKGRATVTVNTGTSDTSLTLTARTRDDRLPAHRQASKSMVAKPHQSRNHNFLHINVNSARVELGSNLMVRLTLSSQSRQLDVTYLILSRGQLVEFGRQLSNGQEPVTLNLPVTKKMLPSFRLIAYYHPTPTEVVSNSVWVDVDDDSCMGMLKLEATFSRLSYEPRTTFRLRITGDPGATVGLVAVDKGVHVLNKKHLLTQRKVWETVEKGDTGCTPGGGKNSMEVFFDAGLMFHTDTADGTAYRQEVKCPPPPARKRRDTLSEEDDSYIDSFEIDSRTAFPQSWMWYTFNIPVCPGNPHCEVNTYDKMIPLKDTVTTWLFTGISLSQNNSICVGKPLEVAVFLPFSIDLKLPFSAVVGEQMEIRAVLHNYINDPITVRLELTENVDLCSSASKRGQFMQEVKIAPSTTRAVPFVIIPMKHGELNVEVKAAVKDSWLMDGVMKRLRVVPKGVLTKVNKVVELDPKGGTQELTITNTIPQTEMVPNAPSSSKVFLTGREPVRPGVENVIGASSMGSLIVQPTGSGEEIMNLMTQTVIATTYVDKTNQWDAVGLKKRRQALGHIMTGVRKEVAYAKADGSFAVYTNEKSSTWLTAFVVKIFSLAEALVSIDNRVICNAVKFLILRAQLPDGTFRETGPIIHREYTGDVLGRDSDASMTAFCLIAMQESQPICNTHVNGLLEAISKSVRYLEKRLPTVTNPYAVAISSYALANANKLNKEILYNFVSPGMTHWISPRGHEFSLETTAYALLALVKGRFIEDARPIVRWFTRQLKVRGGYGSTQATLMVYQAVAEYWAVVKEPDYNLEVELKIPGFQFPYVYRFNRDNYYTTRASMNFDVNRNVTVTAKGTGEATVTLVTQYYAVPKETVSDCTKYNLSVEFSLETVDENDGDMYRLRMEFFYKNKTENASMSVLEITFPTGFIQMNEDLNALSEGHSSTISHWEYNKELSEKGSIIFYLNKVAHNRVEELTFRMRQTHKVSILQPASVSIYEHYDETPCVRYYHPQKRDGRISTLCKGDVCRCVEVNCGVQIKRNISSEERIAKVCGRNDFAYKVILEDVHFNVSSDAYTMRIESAFRHGTCDTNPHGKLRNFISFSHCRQSLNLQKSKTYLIMGKAKSTLPDPSTQSFEYLLGERTWIEYWPKGEECETAEHRQTCVGMKALIDTIGSHGCFS